MLFDLRGRGRRRTVQGIYLGLALLLGGGLVGFGIGTGGSGGGIVNALTAGGGSSGSSFSSDVSKDRKLIAAHPDSAADWAQLVSDLFLESGTGANYNSTLSEFTTAAHGTLQQLSQAWQQYLTLEPSNPSTKLAAEMVAIYGASGNALNEPANALAAKQIVIAAKPSPTYTDYETLALYAYEAKNKREGDLAAAKAIDLAPASSRSQLRSELKLLAANPNALSQAQSSPTSSSPQTISLPSVTPTKGSTKAATKTSALATSKKKS